MKQEIKYQIRQMAEEEYQFRSSHGIAPKVGKWNAHVNRNREACIKGAEAVMQRLDIDPIVVHDIIMKMRSDKNYSVEKAKQQILNAITLKP